MRPANFSDKHFQFGQEVSKVQVDNLRLTKENQELREYIKLLEMRNLELSDRNLGSETSKTPTENGQLSETIFKDILAKIMLKDNDEVEYIGTFAVITIVKSIRRFLKGGSELESLPIVLENAVDDENQLIPDRMKSEFLERFFSLAHNRVYLIDHIWFYDMLSRPVEHRDHWEKFCHSIALAIGCRLTELVKVTTYPQPESYFRLALKELVHAEMDPIRQIQACLLIATFISKCYHISFYVSAWELTGCAIRKLFQFGHHQKQSFTRESSWRYEFMKRLFWSAYNYDKLLSLSLGRPCSLLDNFVDIPYPVSIDLPIQPTADDYEKLYQLQVKQVKEGDDNQIVSEFTSFVATSKIRMIESRTHLLLYSVNNSIPIADTVESLEAEIDGWYRSLPSREVFENSIGQRESFDFFDLLYYRARLILILPVIMRRSNNERDQLLDQACLAAGKICSCYKNLHKDSILEFSVVALHTLFLAGVTMVYYFKNKGEPEFINIQKDLRACSSLLFVFSERWSEAKTYSELFDDILENVDRTSDNNQMPNKQTQVDALLNSFSTPNDLTEDFWDQILENIKNQGEGV